MKKLVIFIFAFMLAVPGIAQGWASVSGNVTDIGTGSPVPGHEVIIMTDSLSGNIYHNTVLTDSAGYYYDVIPVMADSTGYLYVRIYDCNGMMYQGVFAFSPVNNIFRQDFQICTESVACQAEFTFFPEPAGSPNSFQFTDASTGNITSWFWNFGDGITSLVRNPYHIFPGPGTYETCLTIEGFNCSDMYCMTLTISDTVFCQVYGQIFAGNFPMQNGIVNLFSMAPGWGGYQPFGESFPVDSNGIYYFTLVPAGQYLIQVVPADSSAYMPTYFGDAIEWPWAIPLITAELNNPYNISLRENGTRNPGPGAITGQISGGGMSRSLVEKVNMLLMDSNYHCLMFNSVSESGHFAFGELEFGRYYLQADLPGYNSYAIPLELNAGQPQVEVSLGFMNNNIIGVDENEAEPAVLTVYPNPASDRVNISLNVVRKVDACISLSNLTGQVVYLRNEALNQGQNDISLQTEDLPAGIYTVKVIPDDGIPCVRKVIISR